MQSFAVGKKIQQQKKKKSERHPKPHKNKEAIHQSATLVHGTKAIHQTLTPVDSPKPYFTLQMQFDKSVSESSQC